MVEHGLPRGNHRDQIVRSGFVSIQQSQEGRIEVGEDLARREERASFRFEQAGVLPGINQAGGGGHQQLQTRMRIHVARGDPGRLGRQGNDLIGRIGEAVRVLVIDQELFLLRIKHEEIGAAVAVNIDKTHHAGAGRDGD